MPQKSAEEKVKAHWRRTYSVEGATFEEAEEERVHKEDEWKGDTRNDQGTWREWGNQDFQDLPTAGGQVPVAGGGSLDPTPGRFKKRPPWKRAPVLSTAFRAGATSEVPRRSQGTLRAPRG